MQKGNKKKKLRQPRLQSKQPGLEYKMKPKPKFKNEKYLAAGKLMDKVAVITGGDSGIGRAVALAFAKEGANVAIIYYNEHKDAKLTKQMVEVIGQKCILIPGDISDEKFCNKAIRKIFKEFGKLDIIVNNAAVQFPRNTILKVTKKQLYRTFETNVFSQFYIVKASIKFLKKNSIIINTTSVTAYRGSDHLIDYSSTKGAIVSFTRSLSSALAKKGIRVNGVAPGPVWTPLIPSTFPSKQVSTFGSDVPLGRAAQPEEIAPCYVFLSSKDSFFMTGQILHPNGGEIING